MPQPPNNNPTTPRGPSPTPQPTEQSTQQPEELPFQFTTDHFGHVLRHVVLASMSHHANKLNGK